LTLTNALSGLFCASLNFIDSTRTIRPVTSFQPSGDHSNASLPNLHLLHGTLPREPVCTENLTPFLKLLPCKGKVGISSLLDGHKLFDASWQSMSIDVRPVCPTDGGECVLEMDQTVDMVLDVERSKRQRDDPIPRPRSASELVCDTEKMYNSEDTCYPISGVNGQFWSLSEIFGRPMFGNCPLEEGEGNIVEPVCIDVPNDRLVYTSGGAHERKDKSGFSRCYQTPPDAEFELILPQTAQDGTVQTGPSVVPREEPLLYAERTFTGHGQERGGVQTVLTNPSLTEAVEFVYLESLPWFMKLYLHTLDAKLVPSADAWIEAQDKEDMIQEIYYRPSLDRRRGTQLEVRMKVPAASTVVLSYDFEKAILRYTEYPPDANRGFDIA
jgi:GPI-anchor transamidase subunit T